MNTLKQTRKTMVKVSFVVIGAVAAGFGLNFFLIPNNVTPGGISGLALLFHRFISGKIPVGTLTLLLNLPLFIIGYISLGKKFTINSILGTIAFSLMIDVTSPVKRLRPLLLDMTKYGNTTDYLLCSIFGGLLLGTGLGLIFKGGATTGGTDIAARVLQKKASWLTLGRLVLTLDGIFLIVVFITYKSLVATLYTSVAIFVSSKVIDIVEEGVNYAKEVTIFTNKPETVSNEIMNKLQRGVTLVNASGMYTGEKVNMLICVVYNRQIPALKSIISKHDNSAFVVVKDVRTVHGLW